MKKMIFLTIALVSCSQSAYAHTYSVTIQNKSPNYSIEVGGITIPPSATGKLQVHHGHKYTVVAKQPAIVAKKGQGPTSATLEAKQLENQYFTKTGKDQIYEINPEPEEEGATMTITKKQQSYSNRFSNSYFPRY
jgi:FtsP/CotA-like multicopper oxidase with cupredoxin domain